MQGADRLDLSTLRALGPDWDSYGARPISGLALRTAENLMVVPMSDGGVQIELHAGGANVEIVISPTGAVCGISWEAVL